MKKKMSRQKGLAIARAILDMDHHWSASFGDLGLSDLNYSDLFCRMWIDAHGAFPKTALYEFMPGVSRRTAVRYVQSLIDAGYLIETGAEHDRRIKSVALAPDIAQRLERFLGYVNDRFSELE